MNPNEKISGGYVHLVRSVIESSLWSMPANAVKLGLTCVAMANWQDRKWWDGKQEVVIRRGSFVTSVNKLAAAARMPRSEIQSNLDKLRRHGLISTKATSAWTLISVIQYDYYNDPKSYVDKRDTGGIGTPSGTVTGTPIGIETGTVTGMVTGTNLSSKEFKEGKEEKNIQGGSYIRDLSNLGLGIYPPGFDSIWTPYPNKSGKAKAARAYIDTTAARPNDDIVVAKIAALRAGRKWRDGFVPTLENWLTGHGWNDEAEVEVTAGKKSPF